jgi:hypothetical protein
MSTRKRSTCRSRKVSATVSFPSPAQHIALLEYRGAIAETEQRIDRLREQLRQLVPTWRWAPVVATLQALRGVWFLTAVALVAELGDPTRFGPHHPATVHRTPVPTKTDSLLAGRFTRDTDCAGNGSSPLTVKPHRTIDRGLPKTDTSGMSAHRDNPYPPHEGNR